MKEQFDKKLVGKIKDLFDQHEEPFDSKQWEKLSSLYFKPKKTVWQLYWPLITTGIAASLFLVLVYNHFDVDEVTPNLVTSKILHQTEPNGNQDFHLQDSSFALSEEEPSVGATSSESIAEVPEIIQREKIVVDEENPETIEVILPTVTQRVLSPVPTLQPQIAVPFEEYTETIAETLNTDRPQSPHRSIEQSEALARVNEWLSEGENSMPIVPKTERAGPLKLGIMVSPQASSNATGGMNLGAGVMSEFSLTKRLKLDVGVNYARQSMMPDRSSGIALEMASYASPVQNMDMQNIRTSSNFIGSELQLNFASLDIPVNLKYRIMDRENTGLYLITGLSSMVYLDQQATETFQTNSFFTNSSEGLSFAPSVQNFTSSYSPDGGSNSVDVGGMLNLSVGYEYNLNEGMFISFEPFYKLPLGSLTFANQQFSIGGLNLRMNFNVGK